jgi:hypothetical protein
MMHGGDNMSTDSSPTRRRVLLSVAAAAGSVALQIEYPVAEEVESLMLAESGANIVEQVTPKNGISSGLAFKDSVQKIVAAGVLDPDKFRAAAKKVPTWVERLFIAATDEPIVFTATSAPYLLDLFWPIGLANKAAFKEDSPINTVDIPSYASTGGWSLGRRQGYLYFNRIDAIHLTGHQQAMVMAVARASYRPCCDNSTFFQDCNHGSALLGVLELAASQGATLNQLWALALTANSYWFPDVYVKTALYFLHFHRKLWREIDPRLILSADFSSATGWRDHVDIPLRRANVSLPGASDRQSGC